MGISALVKLMKFKLHLLCVCVYIFMQVVSANVLPVHGYMTLVVTTIKHYINNVKQ